MKHADGGYEQSYHGITPVDGHRQSIVAAELGNGAADSDHGSVMLEAVVATPVTLPALADAGIRSAARPARLSERACALIVALGREGRTAAATDARACPHTTAMAERLKEEP